MATNKTQVGQQWIWEGPLDPTGMPMAKGNSRNGMHLKCAPCKYTPGPITEKAK